MGADNRVFHSDTRICKRKSEILHVIASNVIFIDLQFIDLQPSTIRAQDVRISPSFRFELTPRSAGRRMNFLGRRKGKLIAGNPRGYVTGICPLSINSAFERRNEIATHYVERTSWSYSEWLPIQTHVIVVESSQPIAR